MTIHSGDDFECTKGQISVKVSENAQDGAIQYLLSHPKSERSCKQYVTLELN